MGLEELLNDLEDECRESEETLDAEARKEADLLSAKARQEIAAIKSESRARATAEAESLYVQRRAARELECKKFTLTARKKLLDSVLERTREQLDTMDQATNAEYFRTLLAHASRVFPGGKVFCRRSDAALVTAPFMFSGEISSSGGFVVESPDGTKRLDLRYATLLDEVWESSLPAVSALFFQGQ